MRKLHFLCVALHVCKIDLPTNEHKQFKIIITELAIDKRYFYNSIYNSIILNL